MIISTGMSIFSSRRTYGGKKTWKSNIINNVFHHTLFSRNHEHQGNRYDEQAFNSIPVGTLIM